ncbi:MAG: hypothetical protein GY749_06950 [Desulfobacteraceae bacterium]|nr:hypothetical protein [Desulfobacteraceae bacterium]
MQFGMHQFGTVRFGHYEGYMTEPVKILFVPDSPEAVQVHQNIEAEPVKILFIPDSPKAVQVHQNIEAEPVKILFVPDAVYPDVQEGGKFFAKFTVINEIPANREYNPFPVPFSQKQFVGGANENALTGESYHMSLSPQQQE